MKLVLFRSGYGGQGAKIEIKIGADLFIIDNKDIAELINKEIDQVGYRLEKTARQKHIRLKFGNNK